MSERRGDWCLTYTGKQFWPLEPQAEDICIEDIAHALAHLCRFNGHVRQFYSVAQHSVLVSQIVENRLIKASFPANRVKVESRKALLHDAPEAYVGDMIRPLKVFMPDFQAAESEVWNAICRKFGFTYDMQCWIKEADNTALMTERRDVTSFTAHKWSLQDKFPPMPEIIHAFQPQAAKASFLMRFEQLGGVI